MPTGTTPPPALRLVTPAKWDCAGSWCHQSRRRTKAVARTPGSRTTTTTMMVTMLLLLLLLLLLE
jgi:hypothetical protein